MTRAKLFPFIVFLLLSACASPEGSFPSLERRPFESEVPVEAPKTPPTAVASSLPADMAAKVKDLKARHIKSSSAYHAMLPQVQSIARAAASAPTGSETWINAQLMVTRLDKSRSDAATSAAEMDDLLIKQLDAESQGVILLLSPLLHAVRAEMAKNVADQNREIGRLSREIGL